MVSALNKKSAQKQTDLVTTASRKPLFLNKNRNNKAENKDIYL